MSKICYQLNVEVVNFMIQMSEVRFIQLQIKGQERHTMVDFGKNYCGGA